MADNTTTQSATPATIPASKTLAAYEGTFSGDTALVAPVVLNTVSGAEGSRTFAEVSAANPLPISDAGGSITVDVGGTVTVASHAVTNAGTFAVQVDGSALTALQLIDNPVVVDDAAFTPATTSVMMAGFTFDDSAPDSINEGDAGAARMSANRNIYTTIRDAAGNERGVNVNASGQMSVTVDNTVTVASHAVTNAGTFATQVDGAALTALQLIDNLVLAEDAAHVTADPGVQLLAVRQSSPANLSGTNGDYEPLQVSAGRLWTSATIDTALPAGTANIGDVDVLTVPAPLSTTGNGTAATALRVTIANDSTGVLDTELPAAAALADNAANPTAPAVGAFGMVWDGSTWDRQPGTSADGALVNLGANNDVTVTGTVAVAEVRPASASLANVAASATSVTLLASNANRKQATIYNDSTVALYAKFGATASTSSFTVKIFGNGYYELPFPVYSGVIDGIWDSASGNARITELS